MNPEPNSDPNNMFPNHEAVHLAAALYGLKTTAQKLPGEYDHNFHLTADNGAEYVLKVMRSGCERALIEMQCQALAHLAERASSLQLPRVFPTLKGESLATVKMDDAGFIHAPRRHAAFPTHDQRLANATFVKTPFAPAITARAARRLNAAFVIRRPHRRPIVTRQDNQRIFCDAQFVYRGEQPTEFFVQFIQHGEKLAVVFAAAFARKARERFGTGMMSVVNIARPELQIKWLAPFICAAARDEINRTIHVSARQFVFFQPRDFAIAILAFASDKSSPLINRRSPNPSNEVSDSSKP